MILRVIATANFLLFQSKKSRHILTQPITANIVPANKRFFTVMLALLAFSTLTQSQSNVTSSERYINVTGSAEVVVQPDQIDLEIVLKEYNIDDDNKVSLETIEADFNRLLKKNNVPAKNVLFNSDNYYWYYWWTYRNEYHKQKHYTLKLDNTTDFLALVKDLNIKGVESIRIANTSNKELYNLRKQVKIDAIKAAKEKAQYLLESIGEKVGRVISVDELQDNNGNHFFYGQELLSNYKRTSNSTGNEIDNIATLKLRCEIRVKFEIQ